MNENDKIFVLLREEFTHTKALLQEVHFRHLLRLTSELRNLVNDTENIRLRVPDAAA